jgi:hypothetical protein
LRLLARASAPPRGQLSPAENVLDQAQEWKSFTCAGAFRTDCNDGYQDCEKQRPYNGTDLLPDQATLL